MRFISLFAGVGGFDLGLSKAGHECIGQVEIDPQCLKVLNEHWPNVRKHNDVRTAKGWAEQNGFIGTTDLVCGGFPCQDVSVAGRRAGLAGQRSGLFFDALEFAVYVQAKVLILENVPGLLSSNNGRDFGVVITEMANAGYRHIEWRVLDSQFFGVPQRRRRVFIVGSTTDRSRFPILIEREGVRRDSQESQSQGQTAARETERSVALGSGKPIANCLPAELYHHGTVVNQDANNGHIVITSSSFGGYKEGVGTLRAEGGDLGGGSENLVVHKEQASTEQG